MPAEGHGSGTHELLYGGIEIRSRQGEERQAERIG
jgi:hypothetical protein